MSSVSNITNALSAAICFGVLLIVTNASFDARFASCSSSSYKYCPARGCIDAFSECGTDGCLQDQRKCSNGTCITSRMTCDGCMRGFVRCPYATCSSKKTNYCEDESDHFFGPSWSTWAYWVIVVVGMCVVGALVACRCHKARMYRRRNNNNTHSAAGFTTGVPMTSLSGAPGGVGGGMTNAAFAPPPAYSVATAYPTPNTSYTVNDSNAAPKPYPTQPGCSLFCPPTSNGQRHPPQGAQQYPPIPADSTVSGPVPPAYTEANLPPPPAYEEVTK